MQFSCRTRSVSSCAYRYGANCSRFVNCIFFSNVSWAFEHYDTWNSVNNYVAFDNVREWFGLGLIIDEHGNARHTVYTHICNHGAPHCQPDSLYREHGSESLKLVIASTPYLIILWLYTMSSCLGGHLKLYLLG